MAEVESGAQPHAQTGGTPLDGAAAFSALLGKAGLLWVSRHDAGPQPVWFTLIDGVIHVVVSHDGTGDCTEQPDPFSDNGSGTGTESGSARASTETNTETNTVANTVANPDDGTVGSVWVTVPSKDTGASAGLAHARPVTLPVATPEWETAAAALAAKRLNSASPDLVSSWREQGRKIVRLELLEVVSDVANDAVGGRQAVTVEAIRPRGWRPMRAHARRRRG